VKLWTIWVQSSDGATWLESAWDDESTAENRSGYEEALQAAAKIAEANDGAMRVVEVNFAGEVVYDAFTPPSVTAAASAPERGKESPSA
jgi:hypothetical protein